MTREKPLKVGRVTPCAPGQGLAPVGAHGVARPTNPSTNQPNRRDKVVGNTLTDGT